MVLSADFSFAVRDAAQYRQELLLHVRSTPEYVSDCSWTESEWKVVTKSVLGLRRVLCSLLACPERLMRPGGLLCLKPKSWRSSEIV